MHDLFVRISFILAWEPSNRALAPIHTAFEHIKADVLTSIVSIRIRFARVVLLASRPHTREAFLYWLKAADFSMAQIKESTLR